MQHLRVVHHSPCMIFWVVARVNIYFYGTNTSLDTLELSVYTSPQSMTCNRMFTRGAESYNLQSDKTRVEFPLESSNFVSTLSIAEQWLNEELLPALFLQLSVIFHV